MLKTKPNAEIRLPSTSPRNCRFQALIRITGLFVLLKSLQIILIVLTPSQFDTSSQVLFKSEELVQEKSQFLGYIDSALLGSKARGLFLLDNVVQKLVCWDAVYFALLFKKGPSYEHEWVFGPFWWRLVKYTPLNLIFPEDFANNYYTRLILGILYANLAHYLSIVVFYEWTCLFSKNPKFSLVSTLLLVLNPAGVFLTAPYSEPVSTLCVYCGMYFRELTKHQQRKLSLVTTVVSGLFIAYAIMCRLNTVLIGYVHLYDLFTAKSLWDGFLALCGGGVAALGLLITTLLPSFYFCPDRTAWCEAGRWTFMSFAQSHYWNNGFLRYWTLNNIPNFLFATPIILFLASAVYGMRSSKGFYAPFVHVAALFLAIGVTCFHVQILTRISGFIPLQYWYFASEIYKGNQRTAKVVVGWCFTFIMVQTVLYSAFLPPA